MQKESTIAKQINSAPESLSSRELQDAKQVINTFLLAWKNYGLYPEEHAASKKAIENLVRTLEIFFADHGDLRLSVEKDRLLCDSDLLYEVSSDTQTEDIISLLYRDGIKWFEFQHGLTFSELATFFKIVHKYRTFVEETEGDIVTALMDAELEHIDFKAVDIFWQDLLLIDFSQLHTPPPEPEKIANKIGADELPQPGETASRDIYAKSIADPSRNDAELEISYEEFERLQQMVLEEENWDHTDDVFDLLLVVLQSQAEQENFTAVLDFTMEEAVQAINQGEFGLLLNLFQSLQKISPRETSQDRAWVRPIIDRFFQKLSSHEILDLITSRLLMLTDNDTEKINDLRRVLLYFSPDIVLVLGPIIMQNGSQKVQQMLMEVMGTLCQEDIGPLEKLLKLHGKELGDPLLVILNRLHGDRVNKMFFRLSDHPSDKVKRRAVKELVAREPNYTQKLFSLIDDPSEGLRTCLLAAIAKQRSIGLENMMLNYLGENTTKKDPNHIFACYKALGRCGSNNAIPFLSRILLKQGWNRFMGLGKSVYRESAAVALALLDTMEARSVLLRGSKSRFRVIREASNGAMAKNGVSGEYADD